MNKSNLPKSKQEKTKEEKPVKGNDLDKDIVFTTHKSKVIGPITRRELYEDV